MERESEREDRENRGSGVEHCQGRSCPAAVAECPLLIVTDI